MAGLLSLKVYLFRNNILPTRNAAFAQSVIFPMLSLKSKGQCLVETACVRLE